MTNEKLKSQNEKLPKLLKIYICIATTVIIILLNNKVFKNFRFTLTGYFWVTIGPTTKILSALII